MINKIELDEERLEEIYREELKAHLQRIEQERAYWTLKDIRRETGMSEPYIREHILFDPEFPAWREGNQWRILAADARIYLAQRANKLMQSQKRIRNYKKS